MELPQIIKEIKDRGITAYKIAESTNLTEVGINKILNGQSKNPRRSTLVILENFLHNNNVKNTKQNDVNIRSVEDEIEVFVNKNGVKFFEFPDGTTKIEVLKIPFTAYASYLEAFNDEDKLYNDFSTTTFSVDKVAKGNYLAFSVKNDSMWNEGGYDTPSGAEVLAREIGRHLWKTGFHKNIYGFILMTKSAIYHKDIKAYNDQTGMLLLSSRNPNTQDFEISINDVFRIFNVIKRTF